MTNVCFHLRWPDNISSKLPLLEASFRWSLTKPSLRPRVSSPTHLFVVVAELRQPGPPPVLRSLRLVLLHDQRVRPQVHVEVEQGRARWNARLGRHTLRLENKIIELKKKNRKR